MGKKDNDIFAEALFESITKELEDGTLCKGDCHKERIDYCKKTFSAATFKKIESCIAIHETYNQIFAVCQPGGDVYKLTHDLLKNYRKWQILAEIDFSFDYQSEVNCKSGRQFINITTVDDNENKKNFTFTDEFLATDLTYIISDIDDQVGRKTKRFLANPMLSFKISTLKMLDLILDTFYKSNQPSLIQYATLIDKKYMRADYAGFEDSEIMKEEGVQKSAYYARLQTGISLFALTVFCHGQTQDALDGYFINEDGVLKNPWVVKKPKKKKVEKKKTDISE